jgi:amidase
VTDPLQLSALELAGYVRSGELSSEELTKFFLERIERLNGALMAFVTVLGRRALWAARQKDKAVGRGVRLPVLHGVPCGLKDLVPLVGAPTKFGSRAYRWLIAPFDGPSVPRLRKGGLVILGKTSTSEFGVLPVVEPDIHPPARNPWNLDHTPGGSSGGSAAAMAAGLAAIADASDGGGSVRIPAAFCHLYGFKPSSSLLGNLHGEVNRLGLSVMGPIAHTVEDAAAWLDVLRGDPYCATRESCLAAARKEPRRMKIRLTVDSPIGAVEPHIAAGVNEVARVLEGLGHHVEEVPMIAAGLDDFLPLWQVQLASVPVPFEGQVQPVTRWLRQAGKGLDIAEVERGQRALAERIGGLFGDADVLLSPTVPVSPPRVGAFAGLGPREQMEAISPLGAFTAAFNLSWRPAASVPLGVGPNGLPFAAQLGGHVDRDGELLALCRQLERAMPWRHRRAPGYT